MKSLPHLLAAWAAALWVGGLWAIGYLAAPVLFYHLDDRMLAGNLAGQMFRWIGWMGIVCGTGLLLHRFWFSGGRALKQSFVWIVVVMLLLTLGQQFGIQPLMQELKDMAMPRDVMESMFRDRFAAWHGVSSAVYLLESLLGLWLVARQASR
ncbi:MAG TPA: DUF4149 domain-containing protein [Thiobacillaceae bacterium]|nr:DUF4149 domain-containing protein [Thiobacillaceae bacterium]